MNIAGALRDRAGSIADLTTTLVGRMTIAPVWNSVYAELDAWQASGRSPRFWWRDDDAVQATPALDRLLDVSERRGVPVALSVVPAAADGTLADRIRREPRVTVLQHGWDHVNRAAAGQPECELCASRDPVEVITQLSAGRRALEDLFGRQLVPVLVPPHNRLASQLTPVVARLYHFVSGWGDFGAPAMPSRNVHVDLIDWTTMEPAPVTKLIPSLVVALQLRRHGVLAADLPIGVLSHHLAMTPPVWSSLETVLSSLCAHPIVSFRPSREVFS